MAKRVRELNLDIPVIYMTGLAADEWAEVFSLVREVCLELSTQEGVDGVNVGFNSGVAAGQTVSANIVVNNTPPRFDRFEDGISFNFAPNALADARREEWSTLLERGR